MPDKGKVERPFRYIREDFFLARSFRNLADLNEQLRHWLDRVANPRLHATTRRGVNEAFAEEKPHLVRQVFDSVADRYDLMNDLMSGGIHRLWKAELIDRLAPRPGQLLLDVAGGTGDLAQRFLDRAGPAARAIVCDLTQSMVRRGRDRATDQGHVAGIEWLCGDAERLPVGDASIDAYTIAFGLRNVTHIDAALAEARRVLKPGGRLLFVEHGLAPAPGVQIWQRRLTPVWKPLACGCHLDPPIPALLSDGCFRIEPLPVSAP